MLLERLAQRHARLRRQLQIAYGMDPWPSALIDRIADGLAATEFAIAAEQAREHARERQIECCRLRVHKP